MTQMTITFPCSFGDKFTVFDYGPCEVVSVSQNKEGQQLAILQRDGEMFVWDLANLGTEAMREIV